MAARRLAGLNLKMMDANIVPPGLLVLCYNRPKTLNSMTGPVFSDLEKALNWAAKEDEISATIVTGRGRLYSSGRDMSIEAIDDVLTERAKKHTLSETPYQNAMEALIEFPKLLIAGVNGPAYGIGVTTLGLFDIIYASPTATFTTPFATLGFSPEGCSSYTFPKIMGKTMTNRLLYYNETIKAQELVQSGFIHEILNVEPDKFAENVVKVVQNKIDSLSPQTIRTTKRLLRPEEEKNILKQVNIKEINILASESCNPFQKAAMGRHKQGIIERRNRSKL